MTAGPDSVDHTARDRNEVLALMMSELRRRLPDWEPESIADVGVTLVELLASEADRLAYAQDAVATEAYIGTARRRISVVRHARLLGVHVNNGCNARTWVQVRTDGANVVVPVGTPVLSQLDRTDGRIDRAELASLIATDSPVIFETMRDLNARPSCDTMHMHSAGSAPVIIAPGATQVTLCGRPNLAIGDVISLEGASNAGSAHVVRIVGGERQSSSESGHETTTIQWHRADAPREAIVCGIVNGDDGCRSDVVARGNLVLADHGHTTLAERFEPNPNMRSRWRLFAPDLTFSAPIAEADDGPTPARRLLLQDPLAALAALDLFDVAPDDDVWRPIQDLIGCDPAERRFVVEPGEDWTQIRFGDGTDGGAAPSDAQFTAWVRIGVGPVGNIARHVIGHVVIDDEHVIGATNVVPAVGGVRAEIIDEIRHRVPHAWKQLQSCVIPSDYAARAFELDEVASSFARWTPGTKDTRIELSIWSPDGDASDDLLDEVRKHIEPRRVEGHVIDVRPAETSELLIDLEVHAIENADRTEVEASIRRKLSTEAGAFFAPGHHQLGQEVPVSQIVLAVIGVPGLRTVDVARLERVDGSAPTIAAWEVARLDSQPRTGPDRPGLSIDFIDAS